MDLKDVILMEAHILGTRDQLEKFLEEAESLLLPAAYGKLLCYLDPNSEVTLDKMDSPILRELFKMGFQLKVRVPSRPKNYYG